MTFFGRILIVDDFADWRHFVRSTLQKYPGLRIVAEASDGPEAVEKAQELQPDLIVLDISLPTMNGIEVARQIGMYVPNARILFFSEPLLGCRTRSVTHWFGICDQGRCDEELLPAVLAAALSKLYLHCGTHNEFDRQFSEKRETVKLVAPLAPQNVRIRHEVEFYADDGSLVDGFACLVQGALRVGNPVIVIANEAHHVAILSQLRAADVDTDSAIKTGGYISLNATEVLSAVMNNGFPDPVRCGNLVNEMIVGPAKRNNRAHVRRMRTHPFIRGECRRRDSTGAPLG
jgi:DNA-binding NarL/FixJ family response regulator